MDLSQTQLIVLNENVENRKRFLNPIPCQNMGNNKEQEFCQSLNIVPWLNFELEFLKYLLKDPENLLKMDEDQKQVLLKDVANREKFLDPTPHQKQEHVKKMEIWHTWSHQTDDLWGIGENHGKYSPIRKNQWCGGYKTDDIWGIGQNYVDHFPIRKNQWCCDGTKPNPSFLQLLEWRKSFSIFKPKFPKENERLIHEGTHEMEAENLENTPGYFLPVSSLECYLNLQSCLEKLSLEERRAFLSLDHKVCQDEREQNQPGLQPLVFPNTTQLKDNNSEQIKAIPKFQSLEPEGHQNDQVKVKQQGFQPLIVISNPSKENKNEQFGLVSSKFPRLQSLDHEGYQGFQPLIGSSPQSKRNKSEKFKLKSPEFQRRLSLSHAGRQEKIQEQGFQPLIVSSSPSKENLSEQFKLNPKFEWARLDHKGCHDEQEQNQSQGFQPLTGFSPPSKEKNSEQFRLISSEFPSLPVFEHNPLQGFQPLIQSKDQQMDFQPSNLLALEIFEQNKLIHKKDQVQFGKIDSDRFLNNPNPKSYRKPAL